MIIFISLLCLQVSTINADHPVLANLRLQYKAQMEAPSVVAVPRNPTSIFGNPPCEHKGDKGTCYGFIECLALAGSFGNLCPGLQGQCCLFYRSCGQRSSQELVYFRNEQYPSEDHTQNDCPFRIIKRSEDYCGVRVTMEKADLPAKSGGTCEDAFFQVKGIHNNRLKPKCGRLTGKAFSYSFENGGKIYIHIISPSTTSLSWSILVNQVKCSEWDGEDYMDKGQTEAPGVFPGDNFVGPVSPPAPPVKNPQVPPHVSHRPFPSSHPNRDVFSECGVRGQSFRNPLMEGAVERDNVRTNSDQRPTAARSAESLRSAIGPGAAVESYDLEIPNLINTLFAHYAGEPRILYPRFDARQQSGRREFPWQVAIIIDGKFRCSASLIGNSHVLTAAHCVDSYMHSPSSIDLSIGDWDLLSYNVRSVKAIVTGVNVHPSYSRTTLQNDVAVLKLAQSLEYTERIRPICLPSSDLHVERERVILSGWGTNEVSRLNSPLHYQVATVIESSECDKRWHSNGAPKGFLIPSMMCMEFLNDGQCTGDNGAPAVYEYPAGSGTYVQVGILSFQTSTCHEAFLPDVYTRVSYYRNWIQQQME